MSWAEDEALAQGLIQLPDPPRLQIELIPSTSFFKNVRSSVGSTAWDAIRKHVYHKAGQKCQVCGGRGHQWPVECHEVFSYQTFPNPEHAPVQRLERFEALCPACHEVKHFGLARVRGREDQALEHLMRVNSWDRKTALWYLDVTFLIWQDRSKHTWMLALAVMHVLLEKLGVKA